MTRFLVFAVFASSCAHSAAALGPQALSFEAAPVQEPAQLAENHFARDRSALGEAELRQILSAPAFLEENARVGVLPVRTAYALNQEIPVDASGATLVEALHTSGLVELATEVGSEWPVESGIAGLRELAARYRVEYLLLYRHRFVDADRLNPAAVSYLTLIATLFVPGTTLQSNGVLEATLFDVKTGTLLFTVNERVEATAISTPFSAEWVREQQHRNLVHEGVKRLGDTVLVRMRQLVAARSSGSAPVRAENR